MVLSATSISQAKPQDKPRKLSDGRGLFLLIQPSGAKWWRFRYLFNGREKLLSLGVYPDVSLKDARERRDEARRLLANGIDPSVNRQLQANATIEGAKNTFETVANEWLAKYINIWEKSHYDKIKLRLKKHLPESFKQKAIREITTDDLWQSLHLLERRGIIETAHRVMQNVGAIFRYAVITKRAEHDISADLRGALPSTRQKHFPSITDPKMVGALMRAIRAYGGTFPVRCALQIAPLVFVRPGELRKAEWSEFNLEKAEWRIPAAKMKMRQPHIVPLSKQAVTILQELQPITDVPKRTPNYVFPGGRTNGRPMSENTINVCLRELNYPREVMTGHGFRSMASTLLNENGWNRDAIERQLAHGEKDKVRGAYNYADLLPMRREMIQWWADHLDELAENKKEER